MLNQDTESLYKLIAENKRDRQSQQVKKEANQTITHIFYRGNLVVQNPYIFYCIFIKES